MEGVRMRRIAAVTAGLMVAGGIFGTVAGIFVLLVMGLVDGETIAPTLADFGILLRFGIVVGGGLGAVLGPVAAWLLMRHVPLGVAVGGTTLGTLAGGGLALLATSDPFAALFYGVVGFGISAIGLRLRYPGPQRLLRG
jgi:hypothetical protein